MRSETLKFEEIVIKGSARFEVVVDWEHGDADLTTSDTMTILGMDDYVLIDWVEKFRSAANIIQQARSCGSHVDRANLEELLDMEIEYDKIYDSCNTPPNMSIDSIVWYDGCGKRFKVTGY